MEVAGTEEMLPSVPGAVNELENIRSFAFFAILFLRFVYSDLVDVSPHTFCYHCCKLQPYH